MTNDKERKALQDLVKRLESLQVESTITSDWANEFPSNGDTVGSATAIVNGSADGVKSFSSSGSNLGQSGSLVITNDVDSNSLSSSIYPLNFYRQFKARVSKFSNPAGYNTYQISHSDGSSTNIVGWVQDDLTNAPTLANFAVNHLTDGNLRYVSGVPYYNTGGQVKIVGLDIADITGETYNKTENFITIQSDTGSVASTQYYNYNDALGTPIPSAQLTSLTAINDLAVDVGGSGVGVGTLKVKAVNVEGESAWRPSTKQIKYWYSTPTFNENNMTAFSSTLKRVELNLSGATPSYTAADFVSTSAWNSQTSSITGTDEAVVLPDGIKHDETDYSGLLPVGPNYSSGRSGTQYFTIGFNKPQLSKFGINLTGEIISMHIALPGTDLDTTSGLSGWFDASQVIGGGKPGSNGGNGSDAIGQAGNNAQLNQSGTQVVGINFGTWNSSKPGNQNNCILIRIGIGSGKSVTALSVTNAP